MDAFLSAFSGYVPYVALVVLALLFRRQGSELGSALLDRIKGGAAVTVGPVSVGELVATTADARRVAEAKGENLLVSGNPDQFKLLFKAQGAGWKKSTKAMEVPGGCLVQVSTERQGAAGDWTTAEALEYVPGAVIDRDDATGDLVLRAST